MTATKKVIHFMRYRLWAVGLSLALLLATVVSLAIQGLNYGLDFTGGTLIEIAYSKPVDLERMRDSLDAAGYNNAVVVYFGSETDVLVRLSQGYSDTLGDELLAVLSQDVSGTIHLRRVEFVGPQVGKELKEQGGLAVLLAFALVMLYVSLRFQLKFAVAAVAALVHDVLITLGFFSFFQWQVDLTVMAAILALIGYSINDTIVVSDRIRENFRKWRKADPLAIIDGSLTETLGRTLVTSFTTLLVLITLLLLGGELMGGFAMALMIGVLVGTYSSIYVVPAILLWLNVSQEDLLVPVKEGADVDELP